MAETSSRRLWLGRASFILLGFGIILSHLIPLETAPPSLGGVNLQPFETNPLVDRLPEAGIEPTEDTAATADPVRWIAPDLLLLLTLAWVMRRPKYAPAFVIAALFLLADFLFQKPPGLWAGLVLILCEIMRSRARSLRNLPFWVDWSTASLGIIAITAIERFTMAMVLVPLAPMGADFGAVGAYNLGLSAGGPPVSPRVRRQP